MRTIINLSYVGKVGKISADGIIIPPQNIQIFGRFSRFGRGFAGVKYEGKNNHNLKRGERKQLAQTNLTPHARRMIQGAGDFFEWQVQQGGYSSIMITLTYRRNVPDHPTAKKHLQAFIRHFKRLGAFKYFAWVAQLQTGERAIKQGKQSYRAKNGAAIHFHILTNWVCVKKMRKKWVEIVNRWEIKQGFKASKLGGVDVEHVYNASHYISRYISNETKSGNIIGSLWGISAAIRKEIGIADTETMIDATNFEWIAFANALKLNNRNFEVRETTYKHSVFAGNDWNDLPIVFAKDVRVVLLEFVRWKRNQLRIMELVENGQNKIDKTIIGKNDPRQIPNGHRSVDF